LSSDKPVILIGNAVFVVRPFLTPQGREDISRRRVQRIDVLSPGEGLEASSARVAHLTTRFTLALMKGAVMDMMWLFATVMGTLLLGEIIVYKKSA
jgi:hypothetical protein